MSRTTAMKLARDIQTMRTMRGACVRQGDLAAAAKLTEKIIAALARLNGAV